ncbi:MAG: hypothetical protein AVDCRST_MAG77-240, partial [uncultured Chloroflexi bacterium]
DCGCTAHKQHRRRRKSRAVSPRTWRPAVLVPHRPRARAADLRGARGGGGGGGLGPAPRRAGAAPPPRALAAGALATL